MRARSAELLLLSAAGFIAWLGAWHVVAVKSQPLLHAARAVAPASLLIVAALLMDAFDPRRDHTLLAPAAMLTGLSVAVLWRLDGFLAAKQVTWVAVGVMSMAATYLLVGRVQSLRSAAAVCGLGALALLVATMLWGQEKHGARLWLGVPGLAMFQPGEIAKLLLVVFLAGWLSDYRRRLNDATRRYTLLAGLMALLVLSLAMFVLQRDLGAASLVFGTVLLLVYVATGASPLLIAMLGLFAAGLVAAVLAVPAANAHAAAVISRRILAWVNPWAAPQGAGYQTLQGLVSVAHGGLLGAGLGLGLPDALPVAESDMIYAVVCEDLGYAGATAVLMLYALIAWRGFQLAAAARDDFSRLLAAGLSVLFSLQTLLIIAGVLRVLPLTGITLPLLSYGGSSMVSNFIALGLLLCVSRDGVEWAANGGGR